MRIDPTGAPWQAALPDNSCPTIGVPPVSVTAREDILIFQPWRPKSGLLNFVTFSTEYGF